MSSDSLTHGKLDQLRRRCDLLLDESLTFPSFARDLIAAVVEIEQLAAASIIEFLGPQDHRILAGNNLEVLSVDGFYSLDPDQISLLLECLRQQKIMLVSDRAVPEAGLKRHSIVMAPLPDRQPPLRVLELFTLQVPNAELAAHLKEVAETLVGYLKRFLQEQAGRSAPQLTDEFWKQFDVYLLKLQQSLDLKRTVSVAVNDGRALIGCDRVSIAIRHGNRTRIYGISGQESVQHRANLVKAMEKLAHTVIRMGGPITYRGVIEGLPPQLEAPLAEYLSESRTRMVKMVPLREPAPLIKDDDETNPRQGTRPRKVFGLLIVEQATEARPKPAVVERAELITEHIETALSNCERYESIFLLPLWRSIGRGIRWFKGRRLWIGIAVLALLIAVGLGLALIPWDYRVEGKGQAMPVIQHEIFAPWDGDVKEVLVESGQRVRAGETLLLLESDDLDASRIEVENELQEKQKLVAALTQQEHAARRKDDVNELIRIEAELVKAAIGVEGAQAKLNKILSRLEKLAVKAPADGVVATFQVRQVLQNRPVRRGELLLEVMEPDGPWRLELEVPEYRMGHVMTALEKSPTRTLPVEYVMATAVEKSYQGTMTQIATRSNESQAEGTIVEVYADINKADLPSQNIGAQVISKINCGPKSLFYVLFGDVVEFVQRYLWL